jgi:putative transposase
LFARHTGGTGHLYQGRFQSFPVGTGDHLYTVWRQVKGNALRAQLAARADEWHWGRWWRRRRGNAPAQAQLPARPVVLPGNRLALVTVPQTAAELEAVRWALARGRPFGSAAWLARAARQLGWQAPLQPWDRAMRCRSQATETERCAVGKT